MGGFSFTSWPQIPKFNTIPYAAGNFSGAGGMVWTVEAADQLFFGYAVAGEVLFLCFHFHQTSTAIPLSNALLLNVPGAFTPRGGIWTTGSLSLDTLATGELAQIEIRTAPPIVAIYRSSFADYPAITNNLHIAANIFFPIIGV